MSADDTFMCPGCATTLQIPAQLYVEREIQESGAPFIKIGSDDAPRGRTMPCPRCGYAIPLEHILRRPKPGSWISDILGCAVMMGILGAIILFFSKSC
ncbi:MAG TPA: hypothetical protein VF950_05210 [Planctomycetota bacterium]